MLTRVFRCVQVRLYIRLNWMIVNIAFILKFALNAFRRVAAPRLNNNALRRDSADTRSLSG